MKYIRVLWGEKRTDFHDLSSWFSTVIHPAVIKEHTVSSPFVFKRECLAASRVSNPQPLWANQDNNTSL